jgi:hypothetical protein
MKTITVIRLRVAMTASFGSGADNFHAVAKSTGRDWFRDRLE